MISIVIIVKHDRKIDLLLNKLRQIEQPEKAQIIVVDASKGSLNDIRKKHKETDWIEFENKTDKQITIPEQRNLGVAQAKGDVIVFIDADCIPYENWLTELITPIRKENEMLSAGRVISSDPNSIFEQHSKKLKNITHVNEAPTMNLAVKKEVFDKIGLFDENFPIGEDIDFCWRASKMGYRIKLAHSAKIHHDLGSFGHEIRRMFLYGQARIKLYVKHNYRRKYLIEELMIIMYPLYFLSLPLTIFFPYYLFLGIILIINNIGANFLKNILLKTSYGLGMLKGLLKYWHKLLWNSY